MVSIQEQDIYWETTAKEEMLLTEGSGSIRALLSQSVKAILQERASLQLSKSLSSLQLFNDGVS